MREKAITLKGDAKLAAIVTTPKDVKRASTAPTILILNEGILHRIGAGRMHVKVARHLADLGYICLRMDHSSIGDSSPRRGTQAFEEAAVHEVQLAMDYMSKVYGSERFIIYGLCSGSDVAFELGVLDDRVVGLIQLDAHVYETTKSKWKKRISHYGPRLLKLSAWRNAISRKLGEIKAGRKASIADVLDEEGRDEWYADPDYIRVKPPHEYVEKGLRTIIEKNVAMYVCFTDGGYYGTYNYVDQYRDAFGNLDFGDLLDVQWIEGSTHLFTALAHQEQLLSEIEAWLTKHDLLPTAPAAEAA